MSDWHTISLSDAARRLFQGCIAAASKVLRTRSAIASINVWSLSPDELLINSWMSLSFADHLWKPGIASERWSTSSAFANLRATA